MGGVRQILSASDPAPTVASRAKLPHLFVFLEGGWEGPIGTCRKMRCEPFAGAGGELRVSSFCHATEPSHDRPGHHAPFFVAFFFAALAAADA